MAVTKVDELNTAQCRVYLATSLPTSPETYYDSAGGVDSLEWRGGEIAYNSTDNYFYVQTFTSGKQSHWRKATDATVAV